MGFFDNPFFDFFDNPTSNPLPPDAAQGQEVALFGGRAPTFPADQAPAPGSAEAADAAAQGAKDQAHDVLVRAGAITPSSGYTSGQVLKIFRDAGVDTSDPNVQTYANNISMVAVEQQAQQVRDMTSMYQQTSPLPGSYQTALTSYGLRDTVVPKLQGQFGPEGGAKVGPRYPGVTGKANYVEKNGVFFYRNGVIADPNTGDVFMPPDAGFAGSPSWLVKAQNWDQDKVENWRAQLYDQGYAVGKKGAWDQSLTVATRSYYESKYLNGGNIVPYSSTPGGTGATGSPPVDLSVLSATIQNQVQAQYQSVFGQDPTPAELKSWTSFVVNTGMQLQKGGPRKALDPSMALGEAEARAAKRIVNDPTAQASISHAQENTRLHDALSSAISATNGLA